MTDRDVFLRAFTTDVERTGPRTLSGRLVPYNVVADVADQLPDGGHDVYREGFRPGAFAPQANAKDSSMAARIGFVHRHDGGLGFLGPFQSLTEKPDGLYGEATILRSRASDVEDLLGNGTRELSVEFRVPRAGGTEVDDEGVRWRTRAHLDQVALEPRGAYRQAEVLNFRAEAEERQREQAGVDEEEAALRAALAEEAAAAELEASAALARRARFEELAGRYDDVARRQQELLDRYGFVPPPTNQWGRRL
jgi:HK97 family phage prohead protease